MVIDIVNLRFLVHHANRDDGETQACCDTEFAQAQRLDAKLHTQRYKDIYSGFVVALFWLQVARKGFIVTNIYDEFAPVGRAQGDVRLFGRHKSEEV